MSDKSSTESRKYLPLWSCGVLDFSSPESRQYVRQSYLCLAGFAVLSFGAVAAVKTGLVPGLWRIPVALAPVVPLGLLVVAFLRYLSRLDELQRQIQLHAIGFALAGSALFCVAWSFLEGLAGFPPLILMWAVAVMALLHGAGLVLAARRYWG